MEDRQFEVLKAILKKQDGAVDYVKHELAGSGPFYVIYWNELLQGEWQFIKHEAIFFGDQLHSVRSYKQLERAWY